MTVQPALHRQHCSVAAPTQLWLDADGRLGRGHGATVPTVLRAAARWRLVHRPAARGHPDAVPGRGPGERHGAGARHGGGGGRRCAARAGAGPRHPGAHGGPRRRTAPDLDRHARRGPALPAAEHLPRVARRRDRIQLAADFTDMAAIRLSRFREPSEPFAADDSTLRWRDGGRTLTVAAPGSVAAGERLLWRGTAGRGPPVRSGMAGRPGRQRGRRRGRPAARLAPGPRRAVRRPGPAAGQRTR